MTFTLECDKEISVLYKPRSVLPDQILEDAVQKVEKSKDAVQVGEAKAPSKDRQNRTILDKKTYGYDECIDREQQGQVKIGGMLYWSESPKELTSNDIQDYIFGENFREKNAIYKENARLMIVLNKMGIEDTHYENFISDSDQRLYFIDAEVHNTGISTDTLVSDTVKQIKEKGILTEEEIQRIEKAVEPEKEAILKTPSRLVLCPTQMYLGKEDGVRDKITKNGKTINSNFD